MVIKLIKVNLESSLGELVLNPKSKFPLNHYYYKKEIVPTGQNYKF